MLFHAIFPSKGKKMGSLGFSNAQLAVLSASYVNPFFWISPTLFNAERKVSLDTFWLFRKGLGIEPRTFGFYAIATAIFLSRGAL